MKTNINTRIMSHSQTILSKKEKYIDNFIEKNPHLIVSLPIGKLASEMNVGVSNLSRYIRKIGFKKYVDFRFYFAKRIEFLGNIYANANHKADIINNNANYMKYTLQETSSRISEEQLKKACNFIIESDITLCLGLGSSGIAAYDLATQLLKNNVNSTYYWDFHHIKQVLKFLVHNHQKKITILLFSRSLASKEISEIFQIIQAAKHFKIISITSNKAHKKYLVDVKLEYQLLETDSYYEVSSKIGQIYISSLIFSFISSKNK